MTGRNQVNIQDEKYKKSRAKKGGKNLKPQKQEAKSGRNEDNKTKT